jgi:outer membrane protein OmpA-like peptidoglycan-associated protein
MKIALFLFLLISNVLCSQNELKHEVYFDTSKYNIPTKEENRVLLFIQQIDSLEIEKISIFGFCDDIGSDAYNQNLSQQRADAIKELFSKNNINQALISNVDGKGEVLLKIVNTKDAKVIRSLNRRVEIIVKIKPFEKPLVVIVKKKEKTISEELVVGDKIVLNNILFEVGHRTVLEESKKALDDLAEVLVERESIYFSIQGHVCCTQNSRDAVDVETKKQNLSLVRAKYIYDYLAKKGVSKKRMKYVGMRRKFPLGGDPKLDRRVEIVVTHISKKRK